MTPLTTVRPKECLPSAPSGPKRPFCGPEPLRRLPLPARKGHSVGLNCLPPVTSGPKSPFPGPESPPFCHLRPGMRRAGDGDLQKNGTSPSKQAVFDGGRSFCGTSPSLVAVGLRHSCGHLSHLRDASDIRVRLASDIRMQLASVTRAGRLCHLQDISVTCGGLGPLPPGHLFIGLTAGIALFRFLTGIFRFFRFLNR